MIFFLVFFSIFVDKIRKYQKKTNKGETPQNVMDRAANLVLDHIGDKDFSVRKIAKQFDIHYSTLSRYLVKLKAFNANKETQGNIMKPICGYKKPRQVFNEEQESILQDYIKCCSEIMFGLSPIDVRRLAYQCAAKFKIKIPQSWSEKENAGVEWFTGFLKCHSNLSLHQPEATSLARATSFNKENVSQFYNKLSNVLSRFSFLPSNIYNMDESGVSTVLKPNKILAQKGMKQVGAITSAERGQMITLAAAINAQGNSIPPLLIFPRKKFQNHFIRDGPVGCIGAANGSGWMNEETFVQFAQHFISYSKPTKENPVLLLLDNHGSHLSPIVLDICKTNNVIMLSFPPHCSHRLQPLDLTVFGPFKRLCSRGIDSWLKSNPGKTLTIYDLPGIIKLAYLDSFTPSNITSGFAAAGIYPFNPDKFTDSDFLSAYVTDRPNPEPENVENANMVAGPSHANDEEPKNLDNDAVVESIQRNSDSNSPGGNASTSCSLARSSETFSPENVRPLPKAPPRKATLNRRKRTTAILTDTPEKTAIEEEKRIIEGEKKKMIVASTSGKTITGKKKGIKQKKKLTFDDNSTDEEENFCLVCHGEYGDKREEWVQCIMCKMWAHWSCANKNPYYVCMNCESSMSDSSN